jgi:membrane protease YdiL (CAAX protease family)
MSTVADSAEATSVSPFRQLVARRSLTIYLLIAFAGTWLFAAPLVLSRQGLGLLPFALSDAAALTFFLLAVYGGPFLAAFVVAWGRRGSAGVRQLLRRIGQWRFGVHWYLIILLGYPLVFLIGIGALYGLGTLDGVAAQWPLLLSVYLPNILLGLLIPSLGEEPGWRGVALPLLEGTFGPLAGTVVLGLVHGIWHLPLYFVPGAILPGAFDLTAFVANSAALLLSTILWTWIVHGAKNSIFCAILLHATSNATSALIPELVTTPDDAWLTCKVLAPWVMLVILATRGRLGFMPSATDLV